jgi:general secretion pathway protein E
VHGETIAMRILNHESGNRKIADLHMPDGVLDLFNWGLEQRNGLILVTGPTGSGKTTTLHAALTMLNTVGRKIVAVENPVEIQVPGVVQVQSNADIGLDFPRVLRSFLRHDPDVMMVGEIRDKETAEVAVQAALTGHLVLSTLHTNDAASAVTRLEDMGVDRFLIDAVLRLSAAQRLVRVLCNRCKMQSGPDDPGWRWRAKRPNATPCEPMGCPTCGGTGFKGRRAVFEAVSGRDLAQGAEGRDYPRLRDHADELVALGVTSADEAMRVVDLDSGPGS